MIASISGRNVGGIWSRNVGGIWSRNVGGIWSRCWWGRSGVSAQWEDDMCVDNTLWLGASSSGRIISYRSIHHDCSPPLRSFGAIASDGRVGRPATALFFPGQGVQRVSMLSYLRKTFPSTIKPLIELLDTTIAESDTTFPPIVSSPPLSSVISDGPAPLLTATENAQPAILFTSLCFLAVLGKDFGLDLSKLRGGGGLYFLGHSLGEFSALVAAGVLSLSDAITLVRRRGITMTRSVPDQDRDDVGMYALLSPAAHLADLITAIKTATTTTSDTILPRGKLVQLANHNTSGQIVISGHVPAITALLNHLRKFSGHDPRALKLNVSAPFHSALMAPAVDVIRHELSRMNLDWDQRKGEVVGNVSARMYSGKDELIETLPRQAVEMVRWAESIQYLDKEKGVKRWVGFGPEVKVGRGLVKRDVSGEVVMVGEGMGGKEWEEVVKFVEGS